MIKRSSQPPKKIFYAGLARTVIVALSCFTPLSVITLGAMGLSAFRPYLDYVLLPALGIMILMPVISYARWKKACKSCEK
jgi:mercuric ion transport protein